MSSGFTLDTLQDKRMLDDFVEAKRGGICCIMGDRYVNIIIISNRTSNSNGNRSMAKHDTRSKWYIDANNLYGYTMMQKLPCKDFEQNNTITLDEGKTTLQRILNHPDARS